MRFLLNIRLRTSVTTLLPAALFVLSAQQISATPVTGQISLGGYAQANGSTGFGSATGISFANASGTTVSGSSGAASSYGAGSGSFLGLVCSNSTSGCGTVHDIASFGMIQGTTNEIVLSTLSAAAIDFDLVSISSVSHSTNSFGGALSFTAKGTINFTGYDATPGTLILTVDGNNISSYSAVLMANPMPTGTATSVTPEPSSMVLLGTGLLGVLGAARRRLLA